VIGREREIERIMQILSRRTKNNPVLLGEAGVGKTAIVEGLAQRITMGNVPEPLKNRRLIILDLALMVAGTKYRGQFEERIKAVMAEVKRAKDIILFIDEFHTLVGAGAAEGAIDASNVLKPALSRGEIQCIGSTTPTEYRKYIEKDAALERRFQPVMVDPATKEETMQILKGIREKYESYHHVRYTDIALEACAELSSRFITGRFLPDKAIDVMDEAGARVRLQAVSDPPDTKEADAQIRKLEQEKEEAIGAQDFERAALLRDRKLQLERKKEALLREWREKHKETTGPVDVDIISETVSRMTGIPVSKLESKEAERLLKVEEELHKTVVSQDEAIAAVARAIRRSRSGMKDPRRPIGSFIFVGPTGCGKTLLARALAKSVFGQEDALVQIDMSEYMEKHNASRLVGAPPGYVGYEEGGQLTERIRRRPYAVVLLDEIEKAHHEVHNMLLQIMDEGRLTDSFGRNVDFKNVILIMTSNVGAEVIKNQSLLGFRRPSVDSSYESMKKLLSKEIEQIFRPEFLNRLDDVIVFRGLTKVDMEKVILIEMQAVKDRLRQRNINLVVSQEAALHLIDISYNADFGARPLRRAIERHVEDPISDMILRGDIKEHEHVTLRVKDNRLFFDTEPGKGCGEPVAQAESIT
ncbi:MAG: ATP-dependent Clp protease ATP-binding subunit, partial [Planctomycetota bacterium]|nr:ATP-dependent Clp protease ATP-binding subunit [Planctomycetota bacterium]